MTRRLFQGLTALVAGFVLANHAYAQFGTEPAKLSLIKLKDDLYVIHNVFVPGNTTALITNEGVILVDDKFEVDHDNIVAMLKTVTSQPVKYVINTHYHADHSGGNAKLQAAGTLAVASAQARARMIEQKQPGLPDITVQPRGALYLGGKTAEIYWLGRSHTDGDIVVLFPQQRVLAAGDMYTNEKDTPELIDYKGGGSAKEWPATVDKLMKLDFDAVVPGHGDVAKKADLVKYRADTQRLWDLAVQMVKANKSRDEIEKAMRMEFNWADLHVMQSLDGLIKEAR
jgi:glyoxylase-like metal-dependent hydrolase (beta-lactamase superfamily II)